MAAEGVGSLLGAALTPRLTRRIGTGRALLVASLMLPLSFAPMPLPGRGWAAGVFALGNAAFAGMVAAASIVARTYRQIGALAAGSVASWYGPRAALWCTAGATLAVPTLVPTSPIRTRREMSESPESLTAPRPTARP